MLNNVRRSSGRCAGLAEGEDALSKQNARLVTVPMVPEQRSESESTHHLRSAEVQEQSSANLAQVIAGGKNNMPSCASSLTKEQTDALVKYVRGFASSK
jgi:hypothetical protein